MNTVPRIVVGVDGFESSTAALRWAIHQAKLTGAVVDAVTTWHIPPGSGLVPAVDMPDYQDDARIVLTEAITEMCTIDTDVVVRPRVVEGQAGPVLVEAAEDATCSWWATEATAAWPRPCSARSASTACATRRARSSSCAGSRPRAPRDRQWSPAFWPVSLDGQGCALVSAIQEAQLPGSGDRLAA
jgi:hypothetical protein